MAKRGIYIILVFFSLLVSCSKFSMIQKSGSLVEKYDAAVKYYIDGDFYRAGLLFEELIPLLRGRAEAEKAEFYYSYCQYYQRQLLLSAYYFKRFYSTYPRSENAEEGMYMECRSLYEISAPGTQDQNTSEEALTSIQNFMRRFPDSKYMEAVEQYSLGLNEKIDKKHFNNAKLYFKIRRYKSAVVALENYRKDYPDSPFMEEVFFMKFRSQAEYAKRSIKKKQLGRYYEALEYYRNFVDRYPNSELIKSAENIYSTCINRISNLKKS
jgi:outer membrane protein assembly factor BamD